MRLAFSLLFLSLSGTIALAERRRSYEDTSETPKDFDFDFIWKCRGLQAPSWNFAETLYSLHFQSIIFFVRRAQLALPLRQ